MSKNRLILILIVTLIFSIFFISCTVHSPITTKSETNQFADIRYSLRLNSQIEKGVSFENIQVEEGILEESFLSPNPENKQRYKAGDKCLRLSGIIKNDTDKDLIVGMSAEGYNKDQRVVSWTLSAARLIGQDDFDVSARSSTGFKLIQSWSEDILYFEIGAQTFTEKEYYQ